ncbi:hypothetical protein VSVS12_01913 [Vibrio scophthalmi]|uniref:hypothetical protein n=1 Tax=Vibrio scophthalmi TaxID=45658 RepID=UPI0008094120|nr:hypothetical protein [Vibrio scophthalmi]ANS85679.1 hypothetical protein VSVS12_01913 [Vibrio scophthalmi]
MYILRPLTLSISAALIVACGGGGDSGGSPSANTTSFAGTLIVPQTVQQNSLRVLSDGYINTYSVACPNVPDGYEPMANAAVSIEKPDGSVLSQTTNTDNCGVFELSVDESDLTDSVINANLAGFKTLKANANNFKKSDAVTTTPVASTIPSSAEYVISAIQKLDSNDISFAVTDTALRNPLMILIKIINLR